MDWNADTNPPSAKADGDHFAQILVISSDPANVSTLVDYLDDHGFRAASASNLEDDFRDAAAKKPDLVIFDLHPRQPNWTEMLRAVHSSGAPVIIITEDSSFDCVSGLEIGADDCITKSTCLRELVARMRAVLRRRPVVQSRQALDESRGRYRFGGWVLDRRLRSLTDPAGSPVALSRGEYALLVAFIEAPQRALSREHLLHATRLYEDIWDQSVNNTVLRLRRKLEADPSAPRLIQTVRGVGYIFTLPIESLG